MPNKQCPGADIHIETINEIAVHYGFFKDKTFVNPLEITNFFQHLKSLAPFKEALVREGTDLVVAYIGIPGALIVESINNCSKYVYRLSPDMYILLLESLGKSL